MGKGVIFLLDQDGNRVGNYYSDDDLEFWCGTYKVISVYKNKIKAIKIN